jgi:maleylpyruvate isomerase
LAYENVPVNITPQVSANRTPEFQARNPLSQVPVLSFRGGALDGKSMSQSMAIIELLEELAPAHPLLPKDPWGRAEVRRLAEIVNSGTQPLQNQVVLIKVKALGADNEAWAKEFIGSGLAGLEATARSTAGKFLFGDEVTLADVYLVPQLFNARRYKLDLTPYPTLTAVDARCQALAAFSSTHPDRMPDAVKP